MPAPADNIAPLVLHGYAVSNYFNTARAALLEKAAAFNIVRVRASRDDAFLACSPLGKIPYLQTPAGCFSETVPMLEYIEETVDGPALLPAVPFARARVRQLLNVLQLYLDMPMRRLYPGTVMGSEHKPGAVDAVAAQLEVTLEALRRLCVFDPYLLGTQLTHADLLALYCIDVGDRVTRQVYGWSLIERIDGLRAWTQRMLVRDSTRVVAAEFLDTFRAYLNDKHAAYRLGDGGGCFTFSYSKIEPGSDTASRSMESTP